MPLLHIGKNACGVCSALWGCGFFFFFWINKSTVETLSLFKYWGAEKIKVLPINLFFFLNSLEIFVQH